jgi:two-component system response regulator HydG
MIPVIAVVELSSSFGHVWPSVAEAAGARASRLDPSRTADVHSASLIVVAAGGAERDACSVLTSLRTNGANATIAVAGAMHDHRLALDLIRAGADEYFALPADMEILADWLRTRVADMAREANVPQPRFDFSRIIGKSPRLRAALELTARIIPHGDANVLITGETGTGKELIAQAIHHNGPRSSRTLVEINCAALPANLVEAELFGYEAGAFTDARVAKAGLFEVANGGTLFLDEVAELPMELQAKLLRVLDERRVRRLGATHPLTVDVRVIAATHVDLASAVLERRFREDLFYRLNVVAVHLPPLRERGEDVLLLAEHFARVFGSRGRGRRLVLDTAMKTVLMSHRWPGNVRELRNAIERATLLGPSSIFQPDVAQAEAPVNQSIPFPADMESIQQAAARAMLSRHRGNKSAAAAALGISRKRLYTLLHSSDGGSLPHAALSRPTGLPSFVQEAAPATGDPLIETADAQRVAQAMWLATASRVAVSVERLSAATARERA